MTQEEEIFDLLCDLEFELIIISQHTNVDELTEDVALIIESKPLKLEGENLSCLKKIHVAATDLANSKYGNKGVREVALKLKLILENTEKGEP